MDKKQKTLNETTVKLRKLAFFPPFIILIVFVTVSIWNQETFLGIINTINNWIIGNLGWAASVLALVIVIVLVWAAFSDFRKVRIGGKMRNRNYLRFIGLLLYYVLQWLPGSYFGGLESRLPIFCILLQNYMI